MPTTVVDIRKWLKDAPEGTTHMLVMFDTYGDHDFPVYVQHIPDLPAPCDGKLVAVGDVHYYAFSRVGHAERLMESYDLAMNIPAQLSEHRAMHF